jgi:hypothetical protein
MLRMPHFLVNRTSALLAKNILFLSLVFISVIGRKLIKFFILYETLGLFQEPSIGFCMEVHRFNKQSHILIL